MKKQTEKLGNLQFTFLYADIDVDIDKNMYDEDEQNRIRMIVDTCSKSISIDKTYVDYKGTPYTKTFMTEKGWNNFCNLITKTKYGKKCNKIQNGIIIKNYSLMILCYLYQILEDYDYDCSGIYLQLKDNSRFMSEVYTDNTCFPKYPGKWQTW